MTGFDADAARRAGMPEHHIGYTEALEAAHALATDDPSPEHQQAYVELMAEVQRKRTAERLEALQAQAEADAAAQAAAGVVADAVATPDPVTATSTTHGTGA